MTSTSIVPNCGKDMRIFLVLSLITLKRIEEKSLSIVASEPYLELIISL